MNQARYGSKGDVSIVRFVSKEEEENQVRYDSKEEEKKVRYELKGDVNKVRYQSKDVNQARYGSKGDVYIVRYRKKRRKKSYVRVERECE